MTELEKLIEQKKEIERRIKELKDNSKYYGSDAEIKVAPELKKCSECPQRECRTTSSLTESTSG